MTDHDPTTRARRAAGEELRSERVILRRALLDGRELRISAIRSQIDIRIWRPTADAAWQATLRGVRLSSDDASAVVDALRAEGYGL